MKKLLLFVSFALITMQVKLYSQETNIAPVTTVKSDNLKNTDLATIAADKRDVTEPTVASSSNATAAEANATGGLGKKAVKHAKKISSFFSKISKEISDGYVTLASEKSTTAVVKAN